MKMRYTIANIDTTNEIRYAVRYILFAMINEGFTMEERDEWRHSLIKIRNYKDIVKHLNDVCDVLSDGDEVFVVPYENLHYDEIAC